MWRKYFKVVKLVPGRVHVSGYGIIDFSKDNISVELCRKLVEAGFPYLKITDEGKQLLDGESAGLNKPLGNKTKKKKPSAE
jgi:hypothetical protein